MTESFLRRMSPRGWSSEQIEEHFDRLIAQYVESESIDGRLGRPGFFTRLGDAVDFSWTTLFAIEGSDLPLSAIREVKKVANAWFEPLDKLPSEVLVVARDIDSAYQDFGFRDKEMFRTVSDDLRARGIEFEEVKDWPHANRRR